MSESKHTPTPWRLETKFISAERKGKTGKAIILASDSYVAEASEANAAFIVRACNSHEALIEACELALFTMDKVAEACTDRPPNKTQAAFNRAVNSLGTTARLVAALKLARGES